MNKESPYIKSVKALITKIHSQSALGDSLYEQATSYFISAEKNRKKLSDLKSNLKYSQQRVADASSNKDKKQHQQHVDIYSEQLKKLSKKLTDERLRRREKLLQICTEILELIDGNSFSSSNHKSAKLLGTVFMLSPEISKNVQRLNMFAKHLYKSTLSVRLLEALLLNGQIIDEYVLQHCQLDEDEEQRKDRLATDQVVREKVKIPVIMAAIVQDIGRMHPDAQQILKGPDGQQDEFRQLEREQRNELLNITFRQAIDYLQNAIGPDQYRGNSHTEREQFSLEQRATLDFAVKILKSSLKPQNGIGNIIKVPQVYTSVVLSTKANQPITTIPHVATMLRKGADQGFFSRTAADGLLKVTGIFPQGYGVVFIPKDAEIRDIDKYEYAVVNSLYPEHPNEPRCRCVTRNLAYHSNRPDFIISQNYNLFFEPARKAFEKVSPERLLEILSKLCSNFEERKNDELIPRCWHTYFYFSESRNQNLWNNMPLTRN